MKTYYNIEFLETAAETLRSIAHPIRIAIIDLLSKKEQMSVTEIYGNLQIEQAIASHHLRILKSKKVVTVQRSGKKSLYSLANTEFVEIVNIMTRVL